MHGPKIPRGRFVALGAALPATAGATAATAQTTATSAPPARLRRSLVLSGGGALGSYEAGVLQSMVDLAGVADGQPLPQYGIIAGTSVGALNAFFVATGQYSNMRRAWATVAGYDLIRLKPRFAKLTNPSSGIANRLSQAVALAVGLFKNVRGVLDSGPIRYWIQANCDFTRPVLTPLVWAVTNLTAQGPEYFYRIPENYDPERKRIALAAAQLAVGPHVPLREADRSFMLDQLRASAAIPLAFDPVTLPGPNGASAEYVDGGVTANTPVDVARAVSAAVDAVLLDPAGSTPVYSSAIDIAVGTFGTMQRRLIEVSLAKAYLETLALRAVKQMPQSFADDIARRSGVDATQLVAYAERQMETAFFTLRPDKELPATMLGFNDAAAVKQTYEIGRRDGTKGFTPFDYATTS